jgi:hypothetical protein
MDANATLRNGRTVKEIGGEAVVFRARQNSF